MVNFSRGFREIDEVARFDQRAFKAIQGIAKSVNDIEADRADVFGHLTELAHRAFNSPGVHSRRGRLD